ncbi:MAG: YqiA/YcfP family alpha/beta fold hydrolase [Myxococcota bacterium]
MVLPSPEEPSRGFVYLHGFASSPRSKKALAMSEALRADGWAVRVPDLNEGGFEDLTVSRALEQAASQLFHRTILIGSSMGAYVGTLLALRDPRIRGLVLMAPAFDLAERLMRRYDRDVETWRREGQLEVEHYGYGGELKPIRWAFVEDAWTHEGRPSIPSPAYVLTGERDEVVPVELVSEVVRASESAVEYDRVDDDHALLNSWPRALAAARALAKRRFGSQVEP